MRIDNEFEVRAPIDLVWRYMLDVEKVAPCVPGAQLTEFVDDHTWKGKVTIKMGPVSLSFVGTVTIQERDDQNHRVALKAEGREQRGKGAANATSTSVLTPAESGATKVTIQTDLTITGAVAQYGRGMIGDVSQRLTQQFADCLQANIAAESTEAEGAAGTTGGVPAVGDRLEPDTLPSPEGGAVQPASGVGGTAAPVEPTAPRLATPAEHSAPPQQTPVVRAQAKPVGGIRLGLWALWRALVRLVKRLFGGRRA